MKLNPKKCMFGVEEDKFLGHIVTERGIKANPKKIQAVEDMASPKTKKEKDIAWTAEAEATFQDVKQLLKELPTLTAPIAGETLILYMAVSAEAISSVLIAERNGVQMPIYFVSKLLQQSEMNYPPIEKLVYALVHTARRLRRYFQGHPILVLTDQPIKQILKHPESSGCLVKWAIELGEYEINFSPRHAVKGQILAYFLLETTEKVDYLREAQSNNCMWEFHTDGVSSEEGVGAGLVLTNPEGEEHTYALKFCFYASNNEVEYEALLSGLRIASEMGIKNLRAYVDSQIVAQLLFDGKYNQWLQRIAQYIDYKSEKANYIWASLKEGPVVEFHPETGMPIPVYELSGEKREKAQSDIEAKNINMQAIPYELFKNVDRNNTAKDI
ncbi:uncharacterized protein [Rutidosis leptorrhynchoides]|uniref:uncharacterized protein n=1 Tax=Rutidosis leptorrhynchoides TaxID=125765 RepID=UPI003A99075C